RGRCGACVAGLAAGRRRDRDAAARGHGGADRRGGGDDPGSAAHVSPPRVRRTCLRESGRAQVGRRCSLRRPQKARPGKRGRGKQAQSRPGLIWQAVRKTGTGLAIRPDNCSVRLDVRRARQWPPAELGVHPVAGGGPLPAYVRRPHDERLRLIVAPPLEESRLVVVRGEPGTGTTRAAWGAGAGELAEWPLEYPRNAAALATRLAA